ncbi:hypothetical protein MHN79_13115 [Vibrio sp. Of14-4]|uniref:hypothetical protein n=1 Tax=Vibrio sp. Of14-4 TaxID=2724878 RepID=UPI001EF25617|nr:hypothetical protein [Vibrio sp. Of14-4]MCG7490430.1 hypothetical protein [Vibrio sp. Of14-4]
MSLNEIGASFDSDIKRQNIGHAMPCHAMPGQFVDALPELSLAQGFKSWDVNSTLAPMSGTNSLYQCRNRAISFT